MRAAVEITEIISTTDRCVRARVKATGKVANFPRRLTEFLPGAALVPVWLAKEILQTSNERPCEAFSGFFGE